MAQSGGRFKNWRVCWLLLALVPLPELVFAVVTVAQIGADAPNKRLLVDAAWVEKHQNDEGVVVVDVRSPELYEQGHIRDAVNIPMALTYRQEGQTDRLGSIVQIQDLFGAAGIDEKTNVILYDDGSFTDAGRVFWVFEVYGHRRVAVLDGGYASWESNAYDISLEDVSRKSKRFVAFIQPEKLATHMHARLAINNPNKMLIDARSRKEYRGEISKSKQFGHIPNAVSVPWDSNITYVDGVPMSKSLPELEDIYKDFSKQKKIITYCNKGQHSSFTYFVLRMLGRDVSHYDGSWFEWGNSIEFPVEK